MDAIASEIKALLMAEIQEDLQQLSIEQLVRISGFVKVCIKCNEATRGA